MKKIIALSAATVLFCTGFAACSNKIKDADILDMVDGEVVAVTGEDGGLVRDEKGKILVVMTDANGRPLSGDNTTALDLTHAVLMGNKIEYSLFSVSVTDGWQCGNIYNDVVINSTDKNQNNKIVIYSEKKSDNKGNGMPGEALFTLVMQNKDIKVNKSKVDDITIAGVKAKRQRLDITSDVIETKVLSFYTFESDGANYGILCYSKKAGTADKVFEDVLNTMTLY